jgi:hypothetical protein
MFGVTELLICVFVVIMLLIEPYIRPHCLKFRRSTMLAWEKHRRKRQRERRRQEERRWEAAARVAALYPAQQVFNQRGEPIDAPPYRPEPMRSGFDLPKRVGGFRFNFGKIAVIAVCVAYIVFPLDVIPDFIPFLGYGDDFVAGIIGLLALSK